MRERTPCVYIMASGKLGTLYVGVTSNLIGRVMQHRDGTFEGFTKRYKVKRLVWFDVADTLEPGSPGRRRSRNGLGIGSAI